MHPSMAVYSVTCVCGVGEGYCHSVNWGGGWGWSNACRGHIQC